MLYLGMSFSYFALIEYGHQVSMASIIVIFFFGGWLSLTLNRWVLKINRWI